MKRPFIDPFTWWLNRRATKSGKGPWYNNWRGWARHHKGLWPLLSKMPLVNTTGITIFTRGEVIWLWPWKRNVYFNGKAAPWYAVEIGACVPNLDWIDEFWKEYEESRVWDTATK